LATIAEIFLHRESLLLLCGPYGLQIILEDDAVSLFLKRLAGKPAAMPLRPVLAGRVAAAMAKEKGEQLLPRSHEMHGCIYPGSNQISQRFVCDVRHPDRRYIAGSMEDCQLLRIAPVGLDPLSWLAWNHRRRGHGAAMSQACELAMDSVPATARFIAEIKLPRALQAALPS
jgi:hypothetical protein